MRWKFRKSGFTIIELLAVAALIALLATVTLLRYAKMGSQTVLINQSRQLYLAAKYARVAAIEQQKNVSLKLDKSGRQIILESEIEDIVSDQNDLAAGVANANQAVPQIKNTYFRPIVLDNKLFVEQFVVDGIEMQQNKSFFYPDGTAQACVIQLGDGQRHASVSVTQTGRVKLEVGQPIAFQTGRIDLDQTE